MFLDDLLLPTLLREFEPLIHQNHHLLLMLVKLLPHVEQGHVYETIEFTKNGFDTAVHLDEAANIVPIFNCPSFQGPSCPGRPRGTTHR